jgi:hypothetical protein
VLERGVASLPRSHDTHDGPTNAGPALTRARWLALLGRRDEARVALDEVAALAERSEKPEAYLVGRAEVHAVLGETDEAAELLRARPDGSMRFQDVCGLEWAEPMRDDPRYSDLFGHCPPARRARFVD